MFKELEVSGTGVALTFLGLILLTIGLIVYFRRRYRSFDTQALIDANKNVKSIELSSRTKSVSYTHLTLPTKLEV